MTFRTKQAALSAIEEARAAFLAQAREFVNQSPVGTEMSVDDVRKEVAIPEGIDPRVMGAVFLERDGWKPIGFQNSKRRTCHKRPIRVFRRDRLSR